MPRPSKKEERATEILDAYGRCIARFGVAGTTLEMIAEEAGLARALIRHNVGNKDEILDAFLARFLSQSSTEVEELIDWLPDDNRIDALITVLFDPRYIDRQELSASNALFAAATDNPPLARKLRAWTAAFTDTIASELSAAYSTSKDQADIVANGIVAIYFNFEALAPLGNVAGIRETSESAARLLASTLEQ